MGSISMNNFCCCSRKNVEISFDIKRLTPNRCSIVLLKRFDALGLDDKNETTIIENIEEIQENKEFVVIINKILKSINIFIIHILIRLKINPITKEAIIDCLSQILNDFLKEDGIFSNLEKINKLNIDNKNIESIEDLISLMKTIYNKRNKIGKDTIIYFLKTIYFTLKKNNSLTNDELEFFYKKLSKIYLEKEDDFEDNFSEEKKNDFTNIGTNPIIFREDEKEQEKFKEYDCSIKSLRNSSSYSENSQNQIAKMKEQIKDLKKEIENSKIHNENKKNIQINFLDKAINKRLPIYVYVDENDKFSTIIEKFYEKYPDFEDKQIKAFTVNGKRIKRSQFIKDIKLITSFNICIDY
jgi:hypothetical protein